MGIDMGAVQVGRAVRKRVLLVDDEHSIRLALSRALAAEGLTVDLADFFPSTSARRVRRWFCDQGWHGDALRVLMRLCVYCGGLPQGAPTSPALSNLVNRRLDEELSELAALHAARYSRYCDDLAFSWGTDDEPPVFRLLVEDVLTRCEYRIQPAKGWRLKRADQRPEITGLVLSGRRLRLPDRISRQIRLLRRRRFRQEASTRARLQGYRGLQKMVVRTTSIFRSAGFGVSEK